MTKVWNKKKKEKKSVSFGMSEILMRAPRLSKKIKIQGDAGSPQYRRRELRVCTRDYLTPSEGHRRVYVQKISPMATVCMIAVVK